MARYELIITVQDSENVIARTSDDEEVDGKVAMDPLIRETIGIFETWLRDGKISSANEMQVLGKHLYRAIVNGRVEDLFKSTLRKARAQQERLRVQLSFKPKAGELASMPWEYLYSPDTDLQQGFWLATAAELILSRYMPLATEREQALPSAESKVRILVIVSQPESLGPVIAQPVIDEIEKLKERLPIEISAHFEATLDSLVDKIEEVKPNVIHFIGHGQFNRKEQQGQIALLTPVSNTPDWCTDSDFAGVFERIFPKPRLVFLHLCESATATANGFSSTFSGLAPKLIQAEVPMVVAMQYPITNQAAIAFAKAFYEALGKGRTIDEAVQEGRYRINTRMPGARNTRVFGTPVLYMRSRNGVLLPPNPLSGAAGAAGAQA